MDGADDEEVVNGKSLEREEWNIFNAEDPATAGLQFSLEKMFAETLEEKEDVAPSFNVEEEVDDGLLNIDVEEAKQEGKEEGNEEEEYLGELDDRPVYSSHELFWLQLKREDRSYTEAIEKYGKIMEEMLKFGKAGSLRPVQRMLHAWFGPLKNRIEEEQKAVWCNNQGIDESAFGPLLVLLKPDKLAVLVRVLITCLY
ncbi:unnamed protein product [Choristocarpus tenellus]